MRRRNAVGIENFAISRGAAVKILAVPRGNAHGAVVRIVLGDIDTAADHIGRTDPVDATALRHRLARLDQARARRNAVTRVDAAIAGAMGQHKT